MAAEQTASSTRAPSIAHVLAFSMPLQGHMNGVMRLCKSLASHNILITFVTAQSIQDRPSDATCPSVEQLAPGIRSTSIVLTGPDVSEDFKQCFAAQFIAVENAGGKLLQLIARLGEEGPPVTFILADVLCSSAIHDVAIQLNIPTVTLVTTSQSLNLLLYHIYKGVLPLADVVHATLENDRAPFRDSLPGIPPLRNIDVPHFRHVFDETEPIYRFGARQFEIFKKGAAILLVNSFQELEGPAFDAMSKDAPVYPIGPLTEDLDEQTNMSVWKEDEDCLRWLDTQSTRSVLYMSFGSITLMSKEQIEEIILGLEVSNQRFLWSFRPDLATGESCTDILEAFKRRTTDRGYVVSWAPQTRVLAHPAVGGFLTHCGWNSVIEAVAKGMPMLCWPYFCDQFLNCKLVVEEWKVGMRFEAGRRGIVGRAEVERAVRALMESEEGKVLSKNARSLGEAARRSVEMGGSTFRHMQALVKHILNPSIRSALEVQ